MRSGLTGEDVYCKNCYDMGSDNHVSVRNLTVSSCACASRTDKEKKDKVK